MLSLLVVIIAIVVIVVSSRNKSNTSSTDSRQYDLGYWAGRRDLRREVIQKLGHSKTVDTSTVRQVIDTNQWYPDDYKEDLGANTGVSEGPSVSQQAIVTPQKTAQPVDYSVGLLYLGAFLFVSAASLFVLISGVSGAIKTFVVMGVSLLLYGLGVALSQYAKRLKSVGATFSAIGLMLAPLIGVAAYGYWFNQNHGAAVWLATSVFCIVLYSHALYTLRTEYIGYLFVGVLISLVESGFSQLGLGSFFLAWGLILVSVMSLAAKQLLKGRQLGGVTDIPFTISAIILVPIALLWSLILTSSYGTTQLILSLYFASLYYFTYGWLLGSGMARQVNWLVTQITFLLAGGVWMYTATDSRLALSLYLAIYTVLYSVGSLLTPLRHYIPHHYQGVLGLSSVLAVATLVAVAAWPVPLLVALCVAAVIAWLQWRYTKEPYTSIFAQALLLVAPGVLGWYVLEAVIDPSWTSVLYVVFAYVCALVERLRNSKERITTAVLVASYAIASVAAFFIALTSSGYMTAAVACAVAILVYQWAYFHSRGYTSVVGHVLLYSAPLAVVAEADLALYVLGIAWFVLSGALYSLQELITNQTWRIGLRYSAMTGLVAIACIGVIENDFWFFGPLSLLLLAATVLYEAILQKEYVLREVAAVILMVAIQWLLHQMGLDEFLVYNHLWAGLILILGLLRLRRGESSIFNTCLWLSLGITTIPFAILLLSGSTLVYGWVFIAEHVIITLLGVVFKKAHVLWWGLSATVLAVLYQLRDLQFVALGVLSIFVLGIAMYLALKHQKSLE